VLSRTTIVAADADEVLALAQTLDARLIAITVTPIPVDPTTTSPQAGVEYCNLDEQLQQIDASLVRTAELLRSLLDRIRL
jgi:hypothetical protein